jgi:hypothetical protein
MPNRCKVGRVSLCQNGRAYETASLGHKTSDIFRYTEDSCLHLIGKDRDNNYFFATVKLMKSQLIFYRQFGEKAVYFFFSKTCLNIGERLSRANPAVFSSLQKGIPDFANISPCMYCTSHVMHQR